MTDQGNENFIEGTASRFWNVDETQNVIGKIVTWKERYR